MIPIILLIILLFKIQAEGELFYGKPDGFIAVSVVTLSKLLSGSDSQVFVYAAIILFLFAIGLFIYVQIKKLPKKDYKNLVCSCFPGWLDPCFLVWMLRTLRNPT